MTANDNGKHEGKYGRCPTCGKPAEATVRPFCSKRCRDVDLSRWFGETYRIPATGAELDEADSPALPEDGK